ncbi:unnamed protein product, partial [Amoebophrya sp. A25]
VFAGFLTQKGADVDQKPGATFDHWANFGPAEETWDPLRKDVIDSLLSSSSTTSETSTSSLKRSSTGCGGNSGMVGDPGEAYE